MPRPQERRARPRPKNGRSEMGAVPSTIRRRQGVGQHVAHGRCETRPCRRAGGGPASNEGGCSRKRLALLEAQRRGGHGRHQRDGDGDDGVLGAERARALRAMTQRHQPRKRAANCPDVSIRALGDEIDGGREHKTIIQADRTAQDAGPPFFFGAEADGEEEKCGAPKTMAGCKHCSRAMKWQPSPNTPPGRPARALGRQVRRRNPMAR